MDYWLIGLLAGCAVALYLVLLAVGVLVGVGGTLMQMHRGPAPHPEDQERRADVLRRRGLIAFPTSNRRQRRARARSGRR